MVGICITWCYDWYEEVLVDFTCDFGGVFLGGWLVLLYEEEQMEKR